MWLNNLTALKAFPLSSKKLILWSVDGEKSIDKIISLLETFLTGIFVPENISDFEDFFEFDSFPEVESYELKLAYHKIAYTKS